MKNSMFGKKDWIVRFIVALTLLLAGFAFADPGESISLGAAANNMTTSVGFLAQFITSLSYVMGFGFGIGAILKYKAHRDNPSQVTLGTPITLVFISLAFIFMPMLFTASGSTIFGTTPEQGTSQGVNTFQ